MPLKRINSFPPGGFSYTQPETGVKFNSMVPFKERVREVLDHRTANNLPRAELREVELDVDAFTCARLKNDPQWCVGGEAQKKTTQPSSLVGRVLEGVRSAVDQGRKLTAGAQILSDWLGDGMHPVAPELAQRRADICNKGVDGQRCPKNVKAHPLLLVTGPVSRRIQEHIAHKEGMNLSVIGEQTLGVCEVCICPMPLKVWTPLETIEKRTKPEMMEKFPAHCWIKNHDQPTTT
jgi:hypothetical protein